MLKQTLKLSLVLGIGGLSFIPNIAYSYPLNNNSLSLKTLQSSLLIAQNNNPDALFQEGYNLYSSGKIEEAITAYDEALKVQPNYYEAWFGKGIAFYDLERYPDAINSLTEAINLKPDLAEAYAMRGAIYALTEDLETAVTDLETATQLFQDQNKTEEYQKSLEVLQMLQSIVPNN